MKKFVTLVCACAIMAALAVPATAQTPPDDNITWGNGAGSRSVRPLVWQTRMSLLLPSNPFTLVVKNIIWGGEQTSTSRNIIWGG